MSIHQQDLNNMNSKGNPQKKNSPNNCFLEHGVNYKNSIQQSKCLRNTHIKILHIFWTDLITICCV